MAFTILVGCSTDPASPPAAVAAHPACVINADCPAGAHCDLGECSQDCNTSTPCGGGLACSPRGRCLASNQPDQEPAPSPTYAGALDVSPRSVRLTDRDTSFDVKLASTSKGPVRYRVQISAPHVSIDQPRGEFTGNGTLHFLLDSSTLSARDVAGSVKVFTTLGDTVVDAPIHIGVTGSYSGSLRYKAGAITLGAAHVALDVLEQGGDVAIRIDSKGSLLFPATTTGETTGRGHFSPTEGLDFTVSQLVDPAFGGDRNHFRRPIGRKTRIRASLDANGNLQGTVDATVVGLFAEPVTISGDVLLEFQPKGQDPKFTVAKDVEMPAALDKTTSWPPGDVFGWAQPTCTHVLCGCDDATCPDCGVRLDEIESANTGALDATFSAKQLSEGSASPVEPVAAACTASLGVRSAADYKNSPSAQKCGLVPALACALSARAAKPVADGVNAAVAGRLVSEMLAPGLLVAKNEIVGALSDSFIHGASAETARYDTAASALGPSATWLMQPSVLEFLRSTSPQAAAGGAPPPSGSPAAQGDTYPAARAFADLFYTSSVIDGERARAGAAGASGAQAKLADDAQRRAVLTYMEALTLAEIVRSWGSVPDSVAVRYEGVLTPLDQGFTALMDGANAFGVPAGFVPFVYRVEDVARGATNFEQMSAIAAEAMNAEKILEQDFIADKRTYELNNKDLQQQLSSIRLQFDTQIQTACGAQFDPSATVTDDDWSRCGQDQEGALGELALGIDQAKAKLASAQSRLKGMGDKISIDANALAATQQERADGITFTADTGAQISAIDFAMAVYDTTIQATTVASNTQVFNFGAPAAEAVAVEALGLEKAAIEATKANLQVAQTVHTLQENKAVEWINGMANIQKEMVDLAQLSVEITGDSLGVLQAEVQLRNKLATVKSLAQERRRALAVVGSDPSNDPSYRLLRDQMGLQILKARADAQRSLYLAGSALEYEINMSIGAIDGAVLNAHNATSLDSLRSCFMNIYNSSRVACGSPQEYVSTVSVRKTLGILGPRTDEVTGETLSEGQQFRQLLLRNQNLDGHGGAGIEFATNLDPNNGLWSTDVCADRLTAVQAQLVGDFLGDNQAQLNLSLTGGALMRACDSDALVPWSLGSIATGGPAFAVVQAGVNTFGDAPPNVSFFGQSVARASWRVVIPGVAGAPTNADVDLTHVDDIILKFSHKALPRRATQLSPDVSCLAQIGGGS